MLGRLDEDDEFEYCLGYIFYKKIIVKDLPILQENEDEWELKTK